MLPATLSPPVQAAHDPPQPFAAAPFALARQPLRWTELAFITALVAIAAPLCFHALAARPFDFDEGISVAIARLDWYNFARILWLREGNMSLYYLFLRGWLHFGDSEAFIRSLSAIFSVAAVPVLYFLGRTLFGRLTATIAAALLSVNAYAVRYSHEARSYALLLLLCLFSSLYFVRGVENPSSRNRWTHILASALAIYAHFFAALLLIAQWLSLRVPARHPASAKLRLSWRWIALFAAPVILFVATTGAGPVSWIRRPGAGDLWIFARDLAGAKGPWLAIAYAVACAAAAILLTRKKNAMIISEEWHGRFLVLWLFFPPLLILAISLVRPLFLPRYFLFCLPALLLLAAFAITRFRKILVSAIVLLPFLCLSLQGTASYYQGSSAERLEDWRAGSHFLLTHSHPGDALLFHVAMSRMTYDYYHSLSGVSPSDPAVLYPNLGERLTYRDFVVKPDYPRLEMALPHYNRVWLVLSHVGDPGRPDKITASLTSLLATMDPHAEEQDFGDLRIRLYSK
jgi:mannosyltransferase